MKGITGHRVHDAYANMALGPTQSVQKRPEQSADAQRLPAEAASVKISDGARRLAQNQGPGEAGRVEELKARAAQGSAAFDPVVVAERMVAEFTG